MAIMATFAYEYGANINTVLFVRFTLAAAILWLVVAFRKENSRVDLATLGRLMVLGAMGYGTMSFCFFSAVQRLSPGLAALLLYTYPVIVFVLALLLRQETVNWRKIIALASASAGLILVLSTSLSVGQLDASGIIFGLAAPFIFSFYLLLTNRVVRDVAPLVMTAYICTFAALVFAFWGIAEGSLSFALPAGAYWNLLGIAVVSTALAILALSAGIERIGPAKASIISTIEPAWTVLLSYLVFGEKLTLPQLGGGLFILAGILLLQMPGATEEIRQNQSAI